MMKSLQTTVLALALALISGMTWAAQTVTYYHLDAQGSTIAATNEQGNLMWREAYEPYGVRLRKESTSSNTTWYTGKQEDAGAGLSYFGARWYDPELGRFMGIDPVGYVEESPQSFNRYLYANNNPYRFKDSDGRFAEDLVLGIPSLAVGANSLSENIRQGNIISAAIDVLGIIGDGVAVATPGVPGGIGLAIMATREGSKKIAKDQINRLSKKEIKKLKKAGEDIHDLKGKKNASRRDLFKDNDGNIEVRPKSGEGPGESTGLNINDF